MKQDMIVILDLGSTENTVLAREIRAMGVYSEIYPHDITKEELEKPLVAIVSSSFVKPSALNKERCGAVCIPFFTESLFILSSSYSISAAMASPISFVPSRVFPSSIISIVRIPFLSTVLTAFSTASASLESPKE